MNVFNITKWIFPSSIFLLIFVSRVRSTVTKTINLRNAQQEIEFSGNYSISGTTLSPSLNPERQSFLQLSTHKPMNQVKVHLFEMRGSRFRRQAVLCKQDFHRHQPLQYEHVCWPRVWRHTRQTKCQNECRLEGCQGIRPCCAYPCPKKSVLGKIFRLPDEPNLCSTTKSNCVVKLRKCNKMCK